MHISGHRCKPACTSQKSIYTVCKLKIYANSGATVSTCLEQFSKPRSSPYPYPCWNTWPFPTPTLTFNCRVERGRVESRDGRCISKSKANTQLSSWVRVYHISLPQFQSQFQYHCRVETGESRFEGGRVESQGRRNSGGSREEARLKEGGRVEGRGMSRESREGESRAKGRVKSRVPSSLSLCIPTPIPVPVPVACPKL